MTAFKRVKTSLHRVLDTVAWTTALKGGHALVGPLTRAGRLVAGALSKGNVRVICSFVWQLNVVYKHQGVPGVVKRLKTTNVLLMQRLAGRPHGSAQSAGCGIARTRTGWPRLIPSVHRELLRKGDLATIRLWLTLLGLYRVLDMPSKAKLSTITEPSSAKEWALQAMEDFVPDFIERGRFRYSDLMEAQIEPRLMATSGPYGLRSGTTISGVLTSAGLLAREGQGEGSVFQNLMEFVESWSGYMIDRNQYQTLNVHWLYQFYMLGLSELAKRWLKATVSDDVQRIYGKLALKPEPAGKLRVFAMVDHLTQMMLLPLHRHLFRILRHIPQDGTFAQHKPLERLLKRARTGALWVKSVDLSAATDRFPLRPQVALISGLLNGDLARAWARLLVNRDYVLFPTPRDEAKGMEAEVLRYGAGQPMGAYSSWGAFALCHHMAVQCAAHRVGYRKWFREYALLGDDLVIAHRAVALEYVHLVTALGVEISAAKSLSSKNGSFEFAKRFIFKGIDVSPLALKEFGVAIKHLPSLVGMVKGLSGRVKVTLANVLHALGFGYRNIGSIASRWARMGNRMRQALWILRSPQSPLGVSSWEEWLQMRTAFASVPFSPSQRARVTQSLTDRFNGQILRVLHGIMPEVARLTYPTPFEDFIRPREWMKREALFQMEGASAFSRLVLVPMMRRLGDSLRDLLLKVADPTRRHELECRLGSFEWLKKIERLDWPLDSWSGMVKLFSSASRDLALLPQLRELQIFERAKPQAAHVPRDAAKLQRLFQAIGKVAGRSHQTFRPWTSSLAKTPVGTAPGKGKPAGVSRSFPSSKIGGFRKRA
jgi:hypothetical protein